MVIALSFLIGIFAFDVTNPNDRTVTTVTSPSRYEREAFCGLFKATRGLDAMSNPITLRFADPVLPDHDCVIDVREQVKGLELGTYRLAIKVLVDNVWSDWGALLSFQRQPSPPVMK